MGAALTACSGGELSIGSSGGAPFELGEPGSGALTGAGGSAGSDAGVGGALATGGQASGGAGDGGSGGAGSGGLDGGGGTGGLGSGGSGGTDGAGGAGPLTPITIWIAGDSTVANGGAACPRGWGAKFGALFDAELVTVTNSAIGGRSVRTWLYDVTDTADASGECIRNLDGGGQLILQARWQAMLSGMTSGDYLLIQFGINDGDPTCPRHVGTAAYRESLGVMIDAARERGAHPVLLTPLSSIKCTGSTAVGTRGFVSDTLAVGAAEDVPVIDLHALSVALYNELDFCPLPNGATGVNATTGGAVGAFFCDDHTHIDDPGAEAIAEVIAEALRDQDIGLEAYLVD